MSDEEEAQLGRLAYLLFHGIEECLVSHPSDRPGPQGVDALLEGTEIVGHWYDRTKESAAYFQWMALLAGCWHFRRSRPRERRRRSGRPRAAIISGERSRARAA